MPPPAGNEAKNNAALFFWRLPAEPMSKWPVEKRTLCSHRVTPLPGSRVVGTVKTLSRDHTTTAFALAYARWYTLSDRPRGESVKGRLSEEPGLAGCGRGDTRRGAENERLLLEVLRRENRLSSRVTATEPPPPPKQ